MPSVTYQIIADALVIANAKKLIDGGGNKLKEAPQNAL